MLGKTAVMNHSQLLNYNQIMAFMIAFTSIYPASPNCIHESLKSVGLSIYGSVNHCVNYSNYYFATIRFVCTCKSFSFVFGEGVFLTRLLIKNWTLGQSGPS